MDIESFDQGSAIRVSDWPWPPEAPEWHVAMEIRVFDGRWRPSTVRLAPAPDRNPGAVDTAVLRKVPFADIALKAAAIADAQDKPGRLAVDDFTGGLDSATLDNLSHWLQSLEQAGPRHPGDRHGGDFYRFIAGLHDLAQERSDRPGRLLADLFQVNVETARSWIKRSHQWQDQDQKTAWWEAIKAEKAEPKEVPPPDKE